MQNIKDQVLELIQKRSIHPSHLDVLAHFRTSEMDEVVKALRQLEREGLIKKAVDLYYPIKKESK